MFEALWGNPNVEKILLFLLVNEKCYATQLHRMLSTSLTPIQKALHRLEKGGIIQSYYEGKTRVYFFNPSFPLLSELETLLKRIYLLLSPHKKKDFYFVKPSFSTHFKKDQELVLSLWEKLKSIHWLEFTAKSHSKESAGWNGIGKGEVNIHYENEHILLFQEEGTWVAENGQTFKFSNVFRWTLNRLDRLISLEHLRFGINHPVFLFHLAPTGPHSFNSVHSHLCGEDTYFGHMSCQDKVRLNWRILGPKKNEEIEYMYF